MNRQGGSFLSGELSFYLWGLLAAAAFGSSQLLLKVIIHQVEPLQLNHVRLFMGALFLALTPGTLPSLLQLSVEGWLLAATSAIFGPSLSRVLQMYALRYIPVSQSILFTMLTPVFALVLSVLFLGSSPSSGEILGGIIIMLGISIPIFHLIKTQR